MAQRITMMISDDLISKIRKIQAEQIKKIDKNVSFSHVINEMLRKTVK